MRFMEALDEAFARFFGAMPHLSRSLRRGMARNAWWVVVLVSLALAAYVAWLIVQLVQSGDSQVVTFWSWVMIVICAMIAAIGLFGALGVRKRSGMGWRALFTIVIFFALSQVIALFLDYSTSNLLWTLLTLAVIFYAVYQIRDEFSVKGKSRRRSGKTKRARKKS